MIVFLFIVSICALCDGSDPLVVQTRQGQVRGRYEGGARAWLGVPYAAPPIPRLFPPQAPKAYTEVRNATQFGAACMQPRDAMTPPGFVFSEDCLFLNVYAPANSAPAPLFPVIVWIHGGGFQTGFSDNYNGSLLASASDIPVVVVTLNYRLNSFGFFFLEDSDPEAINLGIQDQRAALLWVSENIAAFGGKRGSSALLFVYSVSPN
jgi:para-nitrobenzyl esterase